VDAPDPVCARSDQKQCDAPGDRRPNIAFGERLNVAKEQRDAALAISCSGGSSLWTDAAIP
jgi:hypothetical protein